MGCRAGLVSGARARLYRGDPAQAVGRYADPARRRARNAADRRARQGTRSEGLAAFVAARLQIFRPHLPDRLFQAGAWAERRGLAALRTKSADRDTAGAMPSRQERHGRSAVRGQWAAGRELRVEEPGGRPELAPRSAAVSAGPRAARSPGRVQAARASELSRP